MPNPNDKNTTIPSEKNVGDKTSDKAAGDKDSFEFSLKRLEEIVGELERGEHTLEQSLAKYDEGVHRLKRCHHILEEIQKKIVLISRKEDGSIEEVPFEKSKNNANVAMPKPTDQEPL